MLTSELTPDQVDAIEDALDEAVARLGIDPDRILQRYVRLSEEAWKLQWMCRQLPLREVSVWGNPQAGISTATNWMTSLGSWFHDLDRSSTGSYFYIGRRWTDTYANIVKLSTTGLIGMGVGGYGDVPLQVMLERHARAYKALAEEIAKANIDQEANRATMGRISEALGGPSAMGIDGYLQDMASHEFDYVDTEDGRDQEYVLSAEEESANALQLCALWSMLRTRLVWVHRSKLLSGYEPVEISTLWKSRYMFPWAKSFRPEKFLRTGSEEGRRKSFSCAYPLTERGQPDAGAIFKDYLLAVRRLLLVGSEYMLFTSDAPVHFYDVLGPMSRSAPDMIGLLTQDYVTCIRRLRGGANKAATYARTLMASGEHPLLQRYIERLLLPCYANVFDALNALIVVNVVGRSFTKDGVLLGYYMYDPDRAEAKEILIGSYLNEGPLVSFAKSIDSYVGPIYWQIVEPGDEEKRNVWQLSSELVATLSMLALQKGGLENPEAVKATNRFSRQTFRELFGHDEFDYTTTDRLIAEMVRDLGAEDVFEEMVKARDVEKSG